MLEVADDVKGLIGSDSVTLVRGSFLRNPSEAFQVKMEEAGTAILKETSCSAFANEMNASSSQPGVTPPPVRSPAGVTEPPTIGGIYADLKQAVSDAGYNLAQAQKVVDLSGLSSKMLSAAGKYLGMVKKTMTAASWTNGGAIQAYLRLCVR
jgi:hypothetical protein